MDSFENISAPHEQLEDLTENFFELSISTLVIIALVIILFSYLLANCLVEKCLRKKGYLGSVYEQKLLFVPHAGTKPDEEHQVTEIGLLLSLHEGPREQLDEAETLDRLKDINIESKITQVEIHQSSMGSATSASKLFHVFNVFKTTSEADGDFWWSLEKNLDLIFLQRSRNKKDVIKNKLDGAERERPEPIVESLAGKGSIKDLFEMLLTHQVIQEHYNIEDSNCQSFVTFVSKRITEVGYEFKGWRLTYSPVKCERNQNVKHLQVINFLTGKTDWPTLFFLVYLEKMDLIDKVMKSGNYDINALHGGITPLQFAIMYSKTKMVKHLLKDPIYADPTTRDSESGGNALHAAVTYTLETEIIDLILAHGTVEVDDLDDNGESALHRAAFRSHTIAVEKLLEKGANPNIFNKNGWSPLHVAAYYGKRTEIIDLILQAQKAQPNQVDDGKAENGATALHYAAGSSNEIIAKHLINKGADLHSRDNHGNAPLHCAAVGAKNLKIIDLLSRKMKDEDLNQYRNDEKLLYWAYRNENLLGAEIAARLLKAINGIAKPQSWADKILEVLPRRVIEIPANLLLETVKKVTNSFSYFTLLDRLRIENAKNPQEIDDILKEDDFDINSRDQDGQTPLLAAMHANNVNAVGCLLDFKGVNLTRRDENGLTPFQVGALKHVNLEILDLLLATGKVDINDGGKSGYTLLHWAMATSDLTAVCFLLSNGAKPNVADQNGATPLHVAAYCADTTDVIKLILEKEKVDINRRDNNGQTALHYAVRGKRVNNVGYLLEKGADRTIRDENDLTPLQVAAVNQNSKIFDLLLLSNEKKFEIGEGNNAEDSNIIELLPLSQKDVMANVNSLYNNNGTQQHIEGQSEDISNPLKGAMRVKFKRADHS